MMTIEEALIIRPNEFGDPQFIQATIIRFPPDEETDPPDEEIDLDDDGYDVDDDEWDDEEEWDDEDED